MNNGDSYLESLLSNRKIVRSYKKVNFDKKTLNKIASYTIKIPTAGFSRGIEIIQVFNENTIKDISNLFNERKYTEQGKDPWISHSVALFFIILNENAYHKRYSEDDKAKAINSNDWDVPYWFLDAGAAMMNCMLLLEEQELSSGFMGLHNTNRKSVHNLLDIPEDYLIMGMITAGVENEVNPKSFSKLQKKKLIHNEKFSK